MKSHKSFLPLTIIISLIFTLSTGYTQSESKADTSAGAMVVAAHHDAVKIGTAILQMGGNAVDAAVATAFVIGVVEPYASGLGGGGAMLIHLKDDNSYHYLDYYMQTSAQADTAFTNDELYSARSICIPGTPHGLVTAVEKYGRLSLRQVMNPAIEIARKGIEVNANFHTILLDKLDVIMQFPETQALYFKNDFPPMVGDTLFNEPLVKVLEGMSREGSAYFYKGDYARQAVADIRSAGGYISLQDFENYTTVEKEPVESDFRQYHIYSAAAPQSGSTLLEILNLFEEIKTPGLSRFDADPRSIHILCEAIKRADVDRFHFLGDPAHIRVPATGLVDQRYAAKRFADFVPDTVNFANGREIPVGDPWQFESAISVPNKDLNELDTPHTTHISVVDQDGNAVSLTQTLGLFFGSGFTSQGVIYNSSMSNFYDKPSPNHLAGSRRPCSTICPTMITRNDSLLAVIGTPGGGRVFNVMAQMILRLYAFGQSPVEAMQAPRFSIRAGQSRLSLENRFSDETITKLSAMGYELKSYPDYSDYFGGVQMIIFDQKSQKQIGVSDPRRTGSAAGVD